MPQVVGVTEEREWGLEHVPQVVGVTEEREWGLGHVPQVVGVTEQREWGLGHVPQVVGVTEEREWGLGHVPQVVGVTEEREWGLEHVPQVVGVTEEREWGLGHVPQVVGVTEQREWGLGHVPQVVGVTEERGLGWGGRGVALPLRSRPGGRYEVSAAAERRRLPKSCATATAYGTACPAARRHTRSARERSIGGSVCGGHVQHRFACVLCYGGPGHPLSRRMRGKRRPHCLGDGQCPGSGVGPGARGGPGPAMSACVGAARRGWSSEGQCVQWPRGLHGALPYHTSAWVSDTHKHKTWEAAQPVKIPPNKCQASEALDCGIVQSVYPWAY